MTQTMIGLEVPQGMTEVTHDEFYALLYADPRDIMPSNTQPLFTTWETRHREVWGWTAPGWRNPGEPRVYAVRS